MYSIIKFHAEPPSVYIILLEPLSYHTHQVTNELDDVHHHINAVLSNDACKGIVISHAQYTTVLLEFAILHDKKASFAHAGHDTVDVQDGVRVALARLTYVKFVRSNTVDDIWLLLIAIPVHAVYVGSVDWSTLITLVGLNVTTGQAVNVQDFWFSKNVPLVKSYNQISSSLSLLQGTHSKTTLNQLYILMLFILKTLPTVDHVSLAQTCLENIHIVSCTQVGLSHCTLSTILSTAMYKYQLE